VKGVKLLFFVTEDWYFCSHRLPLAVAAKNAGYEMVVVTRVREHGEIIRAAGLRLIPLELSRRGMNPLNEIATLLELRRIYRQEQPDIFHHVALKPVLYGSLAAWLVGCGNVVNAMAGMGFLFVSRRKKAKLLRPLVGWAFRLLLNRPGSSLIVQNPDDFRYFKQSGLIDPKKIAMIRGAGVDMQQFAPVREAPGKPVVMLASRLLWDKGVGEFVEAAILLRQQGVAARFVLVGEGDPENPADIPLRQIEAWRQSGDVELWGHRNNMAEVIGQAHVVCLPSYREGLPKVLLEAASCAKPIVATDVPGCREIVHHNENGLLVPVQNSVALAAGIRALLDAPEMRCRMGEAGRRIVEQEFSQKIVIDQTLQLYKKIRVRPGSADLPDVAGNEITARPKLLFFITEDWYFCSHRLPLAVAAKNAGFEVVIMTRIKDHGEVIRAAGLRVIPLELSRRGMNPIREVAVFYNIWRIYRQEQPDILHHVAIKPVLYGSLAAWFVGCRQVVNAMAGMGLIFSSSQKRAKLLRFFVERAFRMLLNRAGSQLILQNPDDVCYFRESGLIDPEKIVLIRGAGVDMQEFLPVPEKAGTPVVMLASRLLWDKGVGEFVEAAALLREQGVDVRFVLVGDSDPENPAAIPLAQLEAWQQSGKIEWWGLRADMPEVFAQAHIVCLPTFYGEGIPKILIEAASCALPIVTTDWPGCREIVRDGENGLLVPIRNSAALAVAIKTLLDDPAMRRRMGEKGRILVEGEFSQEIVIAQTMCLYGERVK